MNRKSSIAAMRKSIKPRESCAPGSAGVPLSGRRGCANRTLLETTRSSVGGGRATFPCQTKLKDPRCFNDDFIQLTFRRLRDFLSQKHFVSEMPTSAKLTSRQFETLFLTLVRSIDPNYNPPSGNNWTEQEVPIMMELLGYPQKVMKSTLQTISSKVGPIMGIIDFLIDLAAGVDCRAEEAVRLLSRDESPQQIDLQIELLTQSTFSKGVTVDSATTKALIADYCARTKGIVNEDEIRQEIERVRALKEDLEANLHALENQELELKSVQDEASDHLQYIERMKQRMQSKKDELHQVEQRITTTRSKENELHQRIIHTRSVVEAQPVSQNDLRKIKLELKDYVELIAATEQKIQLADARLKTIHGSIRVQQAKLDSSRIDIEANLANVNTIAIHNERIVDILDSGQKSEEFLTKLVAEQDTLSKLMIKIPTEANLQLFEINQKKGQLKNSVEFATQDLQALDEKIKYFEARLIKREAELLSKRQSMKNCDNLIAFTSVEREDLKVQLKVIQDQLERAQDNFEHERFQQHKAEAWIGFYEQLIERVIERDRQRMKKLVQFYEQQLESFPSETLARTTIDALGQLTIRHYF